MTRFRFRLESVLGWRAAQLAAEEARLRPLIELRAGLERAMAETDAARRDAESLVRNRGAVTGAELWALAAYREAAGARASELARQYREREREIAAQRERIGQARQRCRLLERLRERRLAEWTLDSQREIEAFSAEAHLARWSQRG